MRDHLLPTNKRGDQVADWLMREPGKHCDGGGLYLEVAAPGQASWMYRFKNGWRSVGSANGYSIEEAREIASKLWKAARRGEDPFALLDTLRAPRATEKAAGKSFAEAMAEYLKAKSPHWMASQRKRGLRRYEFLFGQIPEFTALPVKAIEPADRNRALEHWAAGSKVQRDVKSYMGAIIKYGLTGELRLPSKGDDDEVEHHQAVEWSKVPTLYQTLTDIGTVDARALQFTILTGARAGEVIGNADKAPANWSEITEIDGLPVWVISGGLDGRMKAKYTHSVPLSPAAVALLGRRGADHEPVFKVRNPNVMLNLLQSLDGHAEDTVHGFRSSFEDWGAEATEYPRSLIKLCTAHDSRTKTDKAYQRSKLVAKRRPVMGRWSDFVAGVAHHDAPLVPDTTTAERPATVR